MALNVKTSPLNILKQKKEAKKSGLDVPEPEGLDWAYVLDNENLCNITKTTNISSFCKIQHLKYIAHITRLDNASLQKQLLFKTDRKKNSRDVWVKMESDLGIAKEQIQKTMQTKNKFMSLLHQVFK